MEELSRELEDLRSEMETLKEEYQAKCELSENLRRVHDEQFARLQEAKRKIEKHSKEIDAKAEEIALSKKMYEDLESRCMEKESALKHLHIVNENLRTTTREKLMDFEGKNRELASALDEANTKMEEQERIICSYKEEIKRLKDLLVASQKKCFDVELRAQAPKEVRRREELLLQLEEEKMDVENQLKWKMEQFRHLEEAYTKLQDEFRVAKKEWGSERFTLVDKIQALQVNLDSQTVATEDLHSKLKMCNQALVHEESRRKLLEVQISESKALYDNIFLEYEEARLTIEALTTKRDEEIASLRISLATKTTLVKEMEFRRAHLEQENQELQTSLREYRDAQVNETDAASTLKILRNKFRALENAHRSCSEKLKAKEIEWRTQRVKLEKDLDNCSCQLISKDERLLGLLLELEGCQSSLVEQKLVNEEIATALMLVESKFSESCSVIENLKLEMAQQNSKVAKRIDILMEQLQRKNAALIQAQAKTQREHNTIETLRRRADSLEAAEQRYLLVQKELDACRGMVEESCRNFDCLKEQVSKKESAIRDDLKRALDDLDSTSYALAEKTTELSKMKYELEQQNSLLERLEKVKFDLETRLNNCREESRASRNKLDVAIVDKMEAEKELRQVNDNLQKLVIEKDKIIAELQQHVVLLEEDKPRRESEVASLFKLEAEKFSDNEKKFLEFAKDIDKKLKEIQKEINILEDKFILRESTILMTFEQAIAKYLHTMKDNEKIVAGLHHHVLLLEDVTCYVDATIASQLKKKQVEIHTLTDNLEWITATYVLKEQEFQFKSLLVAELEKEIRALHLNLKSEEKFSCNSTNHIEQLKAELSIQSLENKKKHAQVLNELKLLRIQKINLVDQLGKLKANIEALHNINVKILSDKEELIQEMMGFSDMIGMICHVDEELMINWERIVQKAADENTITKLDKKELFNSALIDDRVSEVVSDSLTSEDCDSPELDGMYSFHSVTFIRHLN